MFKLGLRHLLPVELKSPSLLLNRQGDPQVKSPGNLQQVASHQLHKSSSRRRLLLMLLLMRGFLLGVGDNPWDSLQQNQHSIAAQEMFTGTSSMNILDRTILWSTA